MISSLGFLAQGDADIARSSLAGIAAWFDRVAARVGGVGRVVITTGRAEAPFSGPAWQRGRKRFVDGKVDLFALHSRVGNDDLRASCAGVVNGVPGPPPTVAEVAMTVSFLGQDVMAWEEVVDLAVAGCEASQLPQAMVHPSGLGGFLLRTTPVEERAERQGVFGLGPRALQRYLRGASWGLWLTAGHLDALGGRALVVREAPVARAVERDGGVWLQLSETPHEVPAGALERLERFLAPVLPTPEQIRAADEVPPTILIVATDEDHYRHYAGPPMDVAGGRPVGPDLHLTVEPRGDLATEAAAALERAMVAWYDDGFEEAYGPGFHYLGEPEWSEGSVTWHVDIGRADADAAVDDLRRRLAGWAERFSCSGELRVGLAAL